MFEDTTEEILKELYPKSSDSDNSDEDPTDNSASNEETIDT